MVSAASQRARSEKATVLHVQRMIDWRNSEVEDRRRHYRETIYSIQDSAAQVKAWTEELRKAEEMPVGVMDPDSVTGQRYRRFRSSRT